MRTPRNGPLVIQANLLMFKLVAAPPLSPSAALRAFQWLNLSAGVARVDHGRGSCARPLAIAASCVWAILILSGSVGIVWGLWTYGPELLRVALGAVKSYFVGL